MIPFVGREEEIETIEDIIKKNPKANILILGSTGMGKTELAIRVKERLSQDKLIHCGSYRVESNIEDPINPFLVALMEVFRTVTQKETAKSKLKWFYNVFAKEVWEKKKDIGVAMVKDGLGTIFKNVKERAELDETTSILTKILKDASSEWSTKWTLEKLLTKNKEAVITSYLSLLRQISEQSPGDHTFVLIFDQVENTSEVFQDFLKSIARNLPEKFYLIFALNHEVEKGVEFLNEHNADLMFCKTKGVELQGLNNLDIRDLVEEIRGIHKTPDEVERIRTLTDGRPLMIIQWINSKDFDLSVIDEEKLRLYGYYADNLTAAGSQAKKLATVLSLLPFPLKRGLTDYAGIMQITNFECSELLDKLESKNIFRKYPEGCWFSHGLIKDYIYNNTEGAVKKDAALQIISYLRKKYRKEIEARQLTAAESVYASLLPYSGEYKETYEHNIHLGNYHHGISSYHVALDHYQRANQAAEKLKEKKKIGVVYNNIGNIYQRWSKYDQAIEYYKKDLKICQETGDRQGEAASLNNVGEIYRALGKYNQAIQYYKKSLKICQETGGQQGEGVILNNIGLVYDAWDKYDQAIEYYERSLKIKQEGDRHGEGLTRNNIGMVYHAWGKYDQAIEYFKKSLKICQEIGDRQAEGVILNNIGLVYNAWSKYDQAIEYYKRSLKITQEIGDRKQEGVSLNNIGLVYDAWGKYDQALDYMTKSLNIFEEIGAAPDAKTVRENIESLKSEMKKKKKE